MEVATVMSRMWGSFVSDLDTNGHGLEGWLIWPTYEAGMGMNIVCLTLMRALLRGML